MDERTMSEGRGVGGSEKKLTAEDWKEIEKLLGRLRYEVELTIDGYEVAIVLTRVGPYKNMLIPWVNGSMVKLEWLRQDCEERRHFACPHIRHAYPKKARDELKRLKGRKAKDTIRFLKEEGIDPNRTYTTYSPFWGSFNKLKAHLLKNSKSIEWTNKPKPESEDPLVIEGGRRANQ